MMALQWIFLVAMAMTTSLFGSESPYSTLNYSCNTTGEITVWNPNPSVFLNAMAQIPSTSHECSVLVTKLGTIFVVYNCPMSQNISFILLKTTERPSILTGDFEYHAIRCQQLPDSGAFRKVTNEFLLTGVITTSEQPTVTPSILVDMELQDTDSKVEKKEAIIGEPVRWEIAVPTGYISVPLNCSVFSGDGSDAMQIVLNGCSLDLYLLTHFDYDSPSTRHILVAQLFTFRFMSSTRVVMVCDMLGCVDRYPFPSPCDFSCPGQEVRRRSKRRETRESEETAQEKYIREENVDGFDVTVQTSLEVYDPEPIPLTGGSVTAVTVIAIYTTMLHSLVLMFAKDRLLLL